MLKEQILEISRQNTIGELSPWFDRALDKLIAEEAFNTEEQLVIMNELLVKMLQNYKEKANISNVVLGMSGGVDSALTAALFNKAGWTVKPVLMPILQDPIETHRGRTACFELGLIPICIDLTEAFQALTGQLSRVDPDIFPAQDKAAKVRQGNVRARLRMITLYNFAAKYGGLVASTDNFSELAAGFWTLHGDVGDLSPIQSLSKSWEVPMLAKINNVPESVWRAKPTDGLGVDQGDEAQFGFSYLEFDIMLLMLKRLYDKHGLACYAEQSLEGMLNLSDDRAKEVFHSVMTRVKSTWFKRHNPFNLNHPFESAERYDFLNDIDKHYGSNGLL